ncbi:MAG TPA: FAD-dependent oxidoreductase [Rubrobacter sp.]|nr:FAD-dependent oxidoreductase [Rubrobacter sp.]
MADQRFGRFGDPAEYVETDVLIVGAGAAGLRAAIELTRAGVDVLVLGKRRHGDAHTVWAAGGINASLGNLDPGDRWDIHAADTVGEGHFVNDPRAVEILAREAPERIRELYDWGCPFSLTEDGNLNQRYFGAQSFRRTCFAGDRTGEAMMGTLVDRAREEGVPYREDVYVTKLLKSGGRVNGAVAFDLSSGRRILFGARAVVLAAGGYTSIYRRGSSRPEENNGDAMALAYGAGAALKDMEFVQFHPTGMVEPEEMDGRLVTEAVRGEGGRLYNAEGGRFMEFYSPERMELDARDVVARANYREIQEGRGTPEDAVLLDISHRDPEYIKERLPNMYEQFMEQGVDITEEPMKVSPTAHYGMGGIEVEPRTCATVVEGLYAVGESAAGVHGANRLGGNSLAETVVFGKILGEHLARTIDDLPGAPLDEEAARERHAYLDALATGAGTNDPAELIDELRGLVWDHAGIVRTAGGLREGLDRLRDLRKRAGDLGAPGRPSDRPGRWLEHALDLGAMIVAAEAVLRGALAREESRGAHHREDFPEESDAWRKNILCARDEDGEMYLWTEPVAEVSPEVQKALDEDYSLDYHYLE